MNKLQRYLQSLTNISDQTVNAITESGVNHAVQANSIIFQPDKPFLKLLFLEKGLLRAYRIIDGKDVTFFFFAPGEFAVDYESFLTESKSQLFFESLVDVNYTAFTKSRIKALYDLYPAFERVGRLMAEKAYLSATMRLKEFQAEPLEERYLKLLNHNPALFQQVPQYHIASYLGVSPQSLSRVRAKLQNKNY